MEVSKKFHFLFEQENIFNILYRGVLHFEFDFDPQKKVKVKTEFTILRKLNSVEKILRGGKNGNDFDII